MNILYFSPIYWDFLKQRPQHIAEELSKYHNVFYIEPSISIVSALIKKNNAYKPREFSVNPNLKVIRPSGQFRLPRIVDLLDFAGLNLAYERFYLKNIIEQSDLVWVGSPIFYDLIKNVNKKIIYDKMDDYEKLTKNKFLSKLIRKNEKDLLTKASLTFTSSQFLYDQLQNIENPKVLIRNGLDKSLINKDYQKYSRVSEEIKILKEKRNIVFGYIGSVDHWFDYNAVKQILEHNNRNKVVVVGYNNLRPYKHENIIYFDAVPKSQLGSIIKEFDYCLYTFKRDALLDTIDPVKIYEYLSFNKRIIAVKSIETIRFKKHLKLYDDEKSLDVILSELDNTYTPFSQNELKEFINKNSWDKRVSTMIEHAKVNQILK